MTLKQLQEILARVTPADREVMDRAKKRQAELAKPPGSLGKLEEMSIRLAGITGRVCHQIEACRILVFAADNGVIAEGVSSSPESVTLSQAVNMTRHITGMSALAKYFGDSVVVADVGINADVSCPSVLNRKIRYSTRNLAKEPALTCQEVLDAMAVGLELAGRAGEEGVQAIGVGEMGIGNTTTSSAVLAALTGAPVEQVTGRGGGLTDQGFATKKRVIQEALRRHQPNPGDPLDVLRKVGGLDLAAMTGAFLGCALHHIPRGRRRLHLHCSRLMRLPPLPTRTGLSVPVPCILRGGIPVGGSRAGPGALLAPGYAAGRGQRLSPRLPDFKGGLRCDVRNGNLPGGGHQRRLSGAHPGV